MTDELPATQDADDAKLLNLVRAGDPAAFGVLVRRHEESARWLASELAPTGAEADDLVADTFALVLAIIQLGGGPTDAFRPYVLTALGRVQRDRLLRRPGQPSADDSLLLDLGGGFLYRDAQLAGPPDALIVRGFLSLPERWSAVLWHAEIERAMISDVSPVFGLTRNGVAALHRRAKEGLRQAYLQIYLAELTRPDCQPAAERLGAFIRDSLSARDTGTVAEHLTECDGCRSVCAELADVSTSLRSEVAPLFLGDAAAAYLGRAGGSAGPDGAAVAALTGPRPPAAIEAGAASASMALAAGAGATAAAGATGMALVAGGSAAGMASAAGGSAAGMAPVAGGSAAGVTSAAGASADGARAAAGASADGASAAAGAGAAGSGSGAGRDRRHLSPWVRWIAQPSWWLVGGAATALVAGTVVLSMVLAGNATPVRPDPHHALAVAGPTPSVSAAVRPPSPPARAAHKRKADRSGASSHKTPTTGPSFEPDASPSSPSTSAAADTVQLTAAVSVNGSGQPRWPGYQAVFQVSDTGSAGTGELSVTITLPSGSWVFGTGHHHGGGGRGGWTCQSSGSGATCQHAAIAAGGQAQGTLYFGLAGSSACGQPVQITATSGSASANAQSSEGIQC